MQHYIDSRPFKIFTIDGLYTIEEISKFKAYVEDANKSNRTFTNSPFKNGKVVNPELSNMMYERIRHFLPTEYIDKSNTCWKFLEAPKFIMYAKVNQGQRFGIHTDTGCEYDAHKNKYSKFTVLTYLNDDFEGGCTKFYDDCFNHTITIEPKPNRTLIFDIDLFHSGEPVTNGSKYWIGTELVCSKV